jgi:hypothetical protein
MKLPQLSLRDLFWLVLVAALGSPAHAERPELSAEEFVANAHEVSLEQLLRIFSYNKARVFLYAGSDEKFDYIWLHHQRRGEVTLYRFKIPRDQAMLAKRFPLRAEKGYNLTWAIFPPEWHMPGVEPDEPPKEAAVKKP